MQIELVILGPAVFAFGAFIAYGSRLAKKAHAEIPRIGCGEAQPGQTCRVIGTSRTEKPLVAPVSGAPCVHYRITFYKWVRHHNDSHYEEVGKYEDAADWWLEDVTGRLLVDADGAEIRWAGTGPGQSLLPISLPQPPAIDELLRRMDLSSTFSGTDYSEVYVPVDRKLLAQGKIEQYPKGLILGGRSELVLSTSLREDKLGVSPITGIVGVLLALIGAALLAYGLVVAPEPEAPAGRPFKTYQGAPGPY